MADKLSNDMRRYIELHKNLFTLINAGLSDSAEADELRDEMDLLWINAHSEQRAMMLRIIEDDSR